MDSVTIWAASVPLFAATIGAVGSFVSGRRFDPYKGASHRIEKLVELTDQVGSFQVTADEDETKIDQESAIDLAIRVLNDRLREIANAEAKPERAITQVICMAMILNLSIILVMGCLTLISNPQTQVPFLPLNGTADRAYIWLFLAIGVLLVALTSYGCLDGITKRPRPQYADIE